MAVPFAGDRRRNMTQENELNTLDIQGEHPPIIADDAVETTEADGVHLDEVDEKPETAEMTAEIEKLRKLKEKTAKAEKETGYWRRKEAEARIQYEQPKPQPQTQIPAAAEAAPKQDDFDDYNDYVKAEAAHQATHAVKAARAEWDRDAKNKGEEEAQEERQAGLKTKMDEGYGKYEDFADVTFDQTATHITPMIVDILADCDNPADVAYHLAKNRIDGVRIARLTPTMAAREMLKLDQSFNEGGKPPPPEKKSTSAPPPIKPVGSSNTVKKDVEKMTQAEFNEHRKSQGAKPY
jgi:hypothetical protein